jgi:hypothetical protein
MAPVLQANALEVSSNERVVSTVMDRKRGMPPPSASLCNPLMTSETDDWSDMSIMGLEK